MHSYQGKRVVIHHNGDYSGDVIIGKRGEIREFEVPFEDILGLVAEYVRSRKMAQLEDVESGELFGLPEKYR